MARIEMDREDLMSEATALVRRAEWSITSEPATIVAGTRRDGGLSIYFGGDPCWHFDSEDRLRRAFASDRLYRTQGETLAQLMRHRTPTSTELRRVDLSPAELRQFLKEMQFRLATFAHALEERETTLLRQVPASGDLASEILPRLRRIIAAPALAPAFRTRRS